MQVLFIHAKLGFLVTTLFVGVLNYLAMVRYGFSQDGADGCNNSLEREEGEKDVISVSFDPIVDLSLAEFRSIGDRLTSKIAAVSTGTKHSLKDGAHNA